MTTDDREAAERHRLAAQRAEEATLWDEAAREYEAGLSLVSASDGGLGQDEAALLTSLGSCYWNLSEARTAWRTLRRAIALYQERGDGAGMARATLEVLRIWGPPDRQRAMAQEALDALGPDGDPHLRARLLLRLRWSDEDPQPRLDEAMALAERHSFDDVLAVRVTDRAWQAYHAGRIDESIALHIEAHETYARLRQYEAACAQLRGAGFATMEAGLLDRGSELAQRCVDYARRVHLRFTEQLALVDLAGVAFARCEYDRCRDLLSQLTTDTDFRADLYRMWMMELSGDTRAALSMMVDPTRAGGAPTGLSQTHGAAAGILYRAGNVDAARRELETWGEIARRDRSLTEEAPALFECIAGAGGDALVRDVYDAYEHGAPDRPAAPLYATLQGRSTAPARGALCLRFEKLDQAERAYSDGLAWCERERVPVDAGLCLRGLADVAERRGDVASAHEYASQAAALFERCGAKLYLAQMT
jgi:tetratricopeptide (TPR) repeat protein